MRRYASSWLCDISYTRWTWMSKARKSTTGLDAELDTLHAASEFSKIERYFVSLVVLDSFRTHLRAEALGGVFGFDFFSLAT